MTRFLENHDEPRAAATFPPGKHEAAAIVTFLSPGLRFFHQGQLEGRRKRISPHLGRGPDEPVDQPLAAFYGRLLALLRQPAVQACAFALAREQETPVTIMRRVPNLTAPDTRPPRKRRSKRRRSHVAEFFCIFSRVSDL